MSQKQESKAERTIWSLDETKLRMNSMMDAKETSGKFNWEVIAAQFNSKNDRSMNEEQCINKWSSIATNIQGTDNPRLFHL